ncbi:MAG: transitional endoplasmic reticulum ATPase [Maribacter sp.]|jgi:transitional endoplasmic reticulum ATPase
MDNNEINELKEAIKASPENIPLRKYLANMLMKMQRYEEAELEYKNALKYASGNTLLKLGLADAFCEQEKTSLGLVIIEELVEQSTPSAKTWFIYAKLLLQSKDPGGAKEAYNNAIAIDENIKDSFLESKINLSNQKNESPEPQKIKLGGFDGDMDEDENFIDIERPEISFLDVGGMDKVKEEIRMKIIHPLEHPEIYKMYGKKIGGGLLMYGPPGCGKTHLARATAGEVNANFISVGISDILDMYMGQSERNLHAIFQRARDMKPCVLFFDEVDALGANRSDMRQSAGRHLINQFLSELDGVETDNDGVLILAATNAPWHLDPAFRRPGRFDRILFVPPPDDVAKASILEIHLKEKPIANIDYTKIVKKTVDYSGADMKALVDIAIESKLDEAIRLGKPVPVETKDLLNAIKKHRATTKEWFQTAKNYALFANEGGLYDDILKYLKIKK